ncbi:response regulator [Sporosarcina sp. NPDC096371]|uniref:response regulator n=1 Tax=Sporosarcina sp. NPDC096371 TaxID=3364530 RepID=UPI0038023F6C
MIKVLIVDDHVLIRKGIVLLLEQYKDIEVVGEAGDGGEAVQLVAKTHPDVVLMDISIPNGLDGLTASREIMKLRDDVKVILLTMHNEIGYIQRGIEVGAHGYLLKNSQGGELYEAIRAVHNGQRYYKVGIPDKQLQKLFNQKGKEQRGLLTIREQEIVGLSILGFSNIEIGKKLYISNKTVENHKANIMQKLELKNRSELIQYGLRNKYVSP